MKKAMLILVCLGVVCSITACGNTDGGGDQTAKNTPPAVKVDYEAEQKMAQADNTVDIAKETFSSSTPEEKTDVSSEEKSSSKKSVTEKKATEKEPEKQDVEYQALGEKLLRELENKTAIKCTVYNVADKLSYRGYEPIENVSKNYNNEDFIKPCAEMENTDEIFALINSLKIEQWKTKKMSLRSMPKVFIYFDNNLHINLEAQSSEESWMSINSPSGSVTYIVPENVYNALFEKYCK